MTVRWLVVLCAGLSLLAADTASAKSRHKARAHCIDRPATFSVWGVFANPRRQPNGCAPPVYSYGEYVGQDPDPFIRLQLLRDPATGYSSEFAR